LLLGIWSDKESAGHKILASLGFDDEKASLLAKTVLSCFHSSQLIIVLLHYLSTIYVVFCRLMMKLQ
jgi:hypothetical protein